MISAGANIGWSQSLFGPSPWFPIFTDWPSASILSRQCSVREARLAYQLQAHLPSDGICSDPIVLSRQPIRNSHSSLMYSASSSPSPHLRHSLVPWHIFNLCRWWHTWQWPVCRPNNFLNSCCLFKESNSEVSIFEDRIPSSFMPRFSDILFQSVIFVCGTIYLSGPISGISEP